MGRRVFNLIMGYFEWERGQATRSLGRVFEYTEDPLVAQFSLDGQPQLDRLTRLPCLFMFEVAAGRLIAVLEDWCAPFPGYHLYYPSRRHASPAFSVLVEALRYRGP